MNSVQRDTLKTNALIFVARQVMRLDGLGGEIRVTNDRDFPHIIEGVVLSWPKRRPWWKGLRAWFEEHSARSRVRGTLTRHLPSTVQFAEVTE